MSSAEISSKIQPGKRFQADNPKGPKGTIKYVGSVTSKGKTAKYVGVEWDSVGRGTHDGSLEGRRYFECSPGQGSFIHPQRVLLGVTLTEAVLDRYHSPLVTEELFITDGSKQKTVVEFVGKDRAVKTFSQIDRLKTISACDCFVSSVSSSSSSSSSSLSSTSSSSSHITDELKMFTNCTSLHLENNLLNDWKEVLLLCSSCTSLQELNLSTNHLLLHTLLSSTSSATSATSSSATSSSATSSSATSSSATDVICIHLHSHTFSHLRVLYLNRVPSAWESVQALEGKQGLLGALEELHLCENNIQTLTWHNSSFSALRLLNLDNNKLCDWQQIARLRHLPCLERLLLNGNLLTSIFMGHKSKSSEGDKSSENKDFDAGFSNLVALSLTENQFTSFDVVAQLTRFPKLRELRLHDCPLATRLSPSALSQLIIARLPLLTMLNLSTITPKLRETAEKFWMKTCFATLPNPTGEDAFIFDEVRYADLTKIHGEPAAWGGHKVQTTVGGAALVSRLMKITFQCANHEAVTQQVPPSMKVMALKLLCKRLFKLQTKDISLSYSGPGESLDELDDPMKALGDYLNGSAAVITVRPL